MVCSLWIGRAAELLGLYLSQVHPWFITKDRQDIAEDRSILDLDKANCVELAPTERFLQPSYCLLSVHSNFSQTSLPWRDSISNYWEPVCAICSSEDTQLETLILPFQTILCNLGFLLKRWKLQKPHN